MTVTSRPTGFMSEADLLAGVLDLAKIFGWRTAHFRPARTANGGWRTAVSGDGKGFPDLVLVRPPRVIFAELKSQRGRLDDDQIAWGDDLSRCPGIERFVWRPADLDNIAKVLR